MYPGVLQTASLGYLHPISSVLFPQIHTRNELMCFLSYLNRADRVWMAILLPWKKWSCGWFPVSDPPPSAIISSLKHPSIYSCPYSSAFCEFLWNFLFVYYTIYFNSLYPIRKRVVQTANQLLNQWNKRSHKNQMASLDRAWDKLSLRQIFSLLFTCVPLHIDLMDYVSFLWNLFCLMSNDFIKTTEKFETNI